MSLLRLFISLCLINLIPEIFGSQTLRNFNNTSGVDLLTWSWDDLLISQAPVKESTANNTIVLSDASSSSSTDGQSLPIEETNENEKKQGEQEKKKTEKDPLKSKENSKIISSVMYLYFGLMIAGGFIAALALLAFYSYQRRHERQELPTKMVDGNPMTCILTPVTSTTSPKSTTTFFRI